MNESDFFDLDGTGGRDRHQVLACGRQSDVEHPAREVFGQCYPTLQHLRPLECAAYVKSAADGKLGDGAVKAMFIGFTEGQKGWRFLTQDLKILTSRNVVWDDVMFLNDRNEKQRMVSKIETLMVDRGLISTGSELKGERDAGRFSGT